MDIKLIHILCKKYSRIHFDELKRYVDTLKDSNSKFEHVILETKKNITKDVYKEILKGYDIQRHEYVLISDIIQTYLNLIERTILNYFSKLHNQ